MLLEIRGSEPIGSISVVHKDDQTQMVHIGYCIGKNWWNRRITTEALYSILSSEY